MHITSNYLHEINTNVTVIKKTCRDQRDLYTAANTSNLAPIPAVIG